MALLFRNRAAAFTWARDTLGLTDGNLDTHSKRLEEAGYIRRGRVLTTGGFQVRLRITPEGDAAFRAYLEGLKAYLVPDATDPTGEGCPGPPDTFFPSARHARTRCRAGCLSIASRPSTTNPAAWPRGRWPASSRSSWMSSRERRSWRSG